MANSNEKLSIKINRIIADIEGLQDEAGSTLVRNIRSEARKHFGDGKSGYPYEFHNSFQNENVVYYDKEQKAVIVDHPAAKVLEYGIGEQTIRAQNGEYMHFTGKDGVEVYAQEVHIKPKKPVGYAKSAIKETLKDLKKQKKYKGVIQ